MSGIVALIHPDGRPVRRETLEHVAAPIAHRGPDGTHLWTEGAVGLAHQMLFTTPESLHEELPASNASGTLTITADARLDNRDELLSRLAIPKPHDTVPDSALILAAYERWGEACVDELVGAFVFAIWDAERHTLFCARDHLGLKNLYLWHESEALFAAASEIKALVSHPEIPEELDAVQFGTYFTREILDAEWTVFKGVRRLLPGHLLKVSSDGMELRRYYEPQPTDRSLPTSDEGYASEFLDLFRDAVQCRLRSAFPIASELSGGLDSSLVTCVARDQLQAEGRGPLSTISLIYDLFPECDERTYIDEVVAQGGISPNYVPVGGNSLFGLLDDIFDHLDDGRAGGNHHLNWLTAAAAHRAGARVLLSGQDGDTTVFHGWQYFGELAREEEWERFAKEAALTVRNIRSEQGQYDMQETFTSPTDVLNAYAGDTLKQWAQQRKMLRLARSAVQIRRHFGVSSRMLMRRFLAPMVHGEPSSLQQKERLKRVAKSMVPRVLNRDLARHIDLEERLLDHLSHNEHGGTVREIQRSSFNKPQLYYSFEKLEQYAAAWGIEARHPFMDKRLVEYCLALPSEQSFNEGWSRVVMRRAMKDVVPKRIHSRVGKASLAAPFRHLLFVQSEKALAETVEALDDKSDLFDVAYLKDAYARRESLTSAETREFANAITMARWLDARKNLQVEPIPAGA